ncbi:MAG TPA: F0F1 ATP synthase subunit A [Tepidisphaeraceae bacterium]|jgi:F-type H+-transporting ATPase subunit a|nr:F0F1 ATP synthase subunit A [Tepidisphaeraceae bacterium]
MSMPIMLTLAAANPIEHVIDHPQWIGANGWWLLTNHMILMCVVAVIMLLIFPAMTRRYRSGEMVPTGSRNMFEAVLLYIRNEVAKPVLGADADRFMPLLWTLFFFILFNNLLGLLPLDILLAPLYNAIGLHHGIYGTPTANPYVTAALALISFIVIHVSGVIANGPVNYAKHFLGGAPWYMAPIMVPVEIIGMLVKPFALFLRLAANMTAGHILLAVLIGFPALAAAGMNSYGAAIGIGIPAVLGAVVIMCLELFVAFLQAYLFTFLTALFIGQMVVHHDHDEHDPHGDHHKNDVEALNEHRPTPSAA